MAMSRPEREWLTHARPSWVDGEDPIFLTICGRPRAVNQFARPEVWAFILRASARLSSRARWTPLLLLAMPDHLHLIVRIPKRVGISHVIRSFKHDVSYGRPIAWQAGAFDHRIRNDESYRAKWLYVMLNPVRAGLVSRPEDWPYVSVFDPPGRGAMSSQP
jgi:putative transposase